jgi:hypothetical protein
MPRKVTASRTRGSRGAILASLVLAGLGLAHAQALRFVFDDAYITFRYAEHLARGLGPVFNTGERVEGYSNFLWTLIVSLVIRWGGDPARSSVLIGLVCAAATLVVVAAAAWRRGMNPMIPGVLVAVSTAWAAWATGGLETSLYTLLVTAGVLATSLGLEPGAVVGDANERTDGPDPRLLLLGAASLGLACLTRPDGLLFAVITGLLVAWRAARGSIAPPLALAWNGTVALFVLPHLAWRASYYGHGLPNTFAVKAPGSLGLAGGVRYLAEATGDLGLVVPAAALACALVSRDARARLPRSDLSLAAVVLIPYIAYVASTGGDFMPAYRFVAPIVPLVALLGGMALESLEAAWSPRIGAHLATAVTWAAIAVYAAINLSGSAKQLRVWSRDELVSIGWARGQTADWLRVGQRLREIAEPTDTLATTAAGAVPYQSGLYTIDLLGLNAPDLSKYMRQHTNRPGHALMYDPRWLIERPPQILLGHPLVLTRLQPTTLSLDLPPEARQQVLALYEVLLLKLPGEPERYVGCAFRHDVVDRIIARAQKPPAASP